MIRVLNKHTDHADPARHVYVGRPSVWGNPYIIGRDGTRDEVIEKYRIWINARPQLIRLLAKKEPEGLVCFCAPLACHADVLVELLEA